MKRTLRLPAALLLLALLVCLPAPPVQAESPTPAWSADWLQQFAHWITGAIGAASTTAADPADCVEPCPTDDPDPASDTTTSDTTTTSPPDGETYPLKDPNG